MMTRLVPYPVQSGLLTLLWMVMTRFSLGHLLLGGALALLAGWAMSSLHPERATPRNWRVVPRLIATLFGHALIATEDPKNYDEAKRVLRTAVGRVRRASLRQA